MDNQNDELEDKGVFQKDVLEERKSSPEQQLSEKDFIYDAPGTSFAFPFWVWLFLFTLLVSLFWGGRGWYEGVFKREVESRPFLEVTNRDLSLLLWQFPGYLRSNVKNKTGYLTGFQYGDKETLNVQEADAFAVAPPTLLFLYHTWKRLIGNQFAARPIPKEEFVEFLDAVSEWQPKNWKAAPAEYVQFVDLLASYSEQDLQAASTAQLPNVIRQAFQGWKNYFKEGTAINLLQPTYAELDNFIKHHPIYARNYWRNIQETDSIEVAGPVYLSSYTLGKYNPEDIVPKEQLPPFLKVAIFNAIQAEKGL